MSNLLSAEFRRLFKSKLFWGCLIFLTVKSCISTGYSILGSNMQEISDTFGKYSYWGFAPLEGSICMMLFASIFIGTEYNNRTIVNKFVTGYTKSNIYLSQLVITITAACIMIIIPVLATTLEGLILIGPPERTVVQYFYDLFCGCCAAAATVSIAQLILTITGSRNVSTITTLLLTFVSFIQACSSEYLLGYKLVEGSEKTFHEYVMHIIPTCYFKEIEGGFVWMENHTMTSTFPIFMLLILVATSVIGMLIFPKKNIK